MSNIEVSENIITGTYHVTIEASNGAYSMVLTPNDYSSLLSKLKKPKKSRYVSLQNLSKSIVIARVWRGDTSHFGKLRRAIVRLAMPDLAKALDRQA